MQYLPIILLIGLLAGLHPIQASTLAPALQSNYFSQDSSIAGKKNETTVPSDANKMDRMAKIALYFLAAGVLFGVSGIVLGNIYGLFFLAWLSSLVSIGLLGLVFIKGLRKGKKWPLLKRYKHFWVLVGAALVLWAMTFALSQDP